MILGELLRKILPILLEGNATGGTTSTLVDSSLIGRYDDASFKDSILVIGNTQGASPPQNQFSVVTDYADATQTFTFSPAFQQVVSAGDYYFISDPQYKLVSVGRVVNDALRNFGIIPLVNTTILVTPNTLEYTLPVALGAYPLDRIEIGNAADGYSELSDWYVVPGGVGLASTLVFNRAPYKSSGCNFRIWYRDYHPEVTEYNDEIAMTIPDKRVIDECRLALQEWLMEKNSDLSPEAMGRLGLLQNKQKESQNLQRVNVPPRKVSKFLNIGKW